MSIQGNRPSLQAMVDSALQLFPADTELQQKKNVLVAPAPLIPKEQEDAYRKYFAIGLEAFNNKNYTVAIGHFEKAAAANPHDYVVVENIGVCYYSMKEYARAIGYFDKVLQRKVSTDGKSEFLKGVSLLNLSRKEEGCYYLTLAHNKNYPEAVAVMATYCK